MTDEEFKTQLVAEVKSLATALNAQNRMYRRFAWFLTAVILILPLSSLVKIDTLLGAKPQTNPSPPPTQQEPINWKEIDQAFELGQYGQAIKLTEEKARQMPNSPKVYRYLGSLYVIKGDLGKAEESYQKAYDLWPSSDNEESLKILKKRRALETAASSGKTELPGTAAPAQP